LGCTQKHKKIVVDKLFKTMYNIYYKIEF